MEMPSGPARAASTLSQLICHRFNAEWLLDGDLCRAAQYCDQTCQLADFKARHKHKCANFVHPPTTSSFLTTPVPRERFAQQPVFAHTHKDSVGCWVSIAGRINCTYVINIVDALTSFASAD